MVKKIFPISVVIFAAILAIADLMNFGIPPTHDGEYHIMRFWQFTKVISEGDLYPRWAPDFNNGFGIPLFNYVYPLPNFAAVFFQILGFGLIESFKLNMAAATIIGAIFMYLWTRKYWGELGGAVSSVFYTFSPYHLLDIYVRGSVGEVWSLGIAPALFWSYLSFSESRQKKFLVLSSIFLALLVLAHNILALIFFGVFILYLLFIILNSKKKKALIIDTLLICFSGLGLSSPFFLPALLETRYVTGLQIFDPTHHFPVLYKLIYSSWGYGFSGANEPDQMSFQIGIANLIAVACSLFVVMRIKDKKILLFFFFLLLITIFMTTSFSSFIWKSVPFLGYIQFPWRLLSLVILLASFLAGSIVAEKVLFKKEKTRVIIAAILILMSIAFSIRYAKAPFYHQREDSHYLTRPNFTDGTNSPGNAFNTKWLSGIPEKREDKIEVLGGSAVIKINELKSTEYSFTVEAKDDSKILINTAYFPGWTAVANTRAVNIENHNGRMLLKVPPGTNNIRVFLDNTPIQKISYIYFLASVMLLVLKVHKVRKVYKVN
jgi:uncharacterized membrane protein